MRHAAAVLALLAIAVPAPALAAEKRHNVIVVMTDDQDFRSMGAMPKTKRLLGKRGTTFTQSIVNLPLCCPSRATFMTGQYAQNHGVIWNNAPIGGYEKLRQDETLPVWLRRAGYRTIHIGKFLNEYGEQNPTEVPQGWDDWHGGIDPSTYSYYGYTINHNGTLKTYGSEPEDYSTDVYAGLAEQALQDAVRAGKPFFLSLAPNAPHTVAVNSGARREGTPAVPAPRHAGNRYADDPLPAWPNFDEADVSDKPPMLASFFEYPMPQEDVDALTRHYQGRMGSLLAVDDMVQRVVAQLKKLGVHDDTDIIFTSDNGWMLGEHRLRDPLTEDGLATGVKFFPFDGSARVPLLAAGPDFPRGRKVRGVVSNADLSPTVLDIAGAKARLPQDGRSLVPVARRPSRIAGRGVLIQTFENPRGGPPYKAIRTQRYNLNRQDGDGFIGLYDLKVDPWELESKHDDPAYARIKAILLDKLGELDGCRGKSCRVNVGKLPSPGR